MTRYTIVGLLLFACSFSNAQTYNNIAQQLGVVAVNSANEHGAGTSCVDFDLDGDDDLTFAIDNEIRIYRNTGGLAQLVDFGFSVDNNAKHPVWIDYDNDGDLDFYFTQSLFPNKLYQNSNNTFTEVTASAGLPQTNVSTFGCAWGDYDRDGDLDLFECTYIYTYVGENQYDWHNHLHQNNGDGTFSDVTLEAGVSDGISLSFQSIWSDLNNDGWLDLYVINDLEHPNRLYLNNTDGTFTEVAEEWNAAVAEMDAMTASVGDYNNDGWQDIFVTNTSIGQCALLQNTGDGFENVANSANVELNMLTWGAAWFDPDLDMDLDLYVCENNYLSPLLPNPYLKNNGAGFFVNSASSTFFFDNNNSYSVATLDWNQDGRADLAVNNFSPQNASVWRSNQPGDGWLKVNLHGTVSNSHGIGAKVTTWVNGVQQTKELFAGENYLGQNTNILLFGTNGANQIDSVVVQWPSGILDRWFAIPSNQLLQAVEGSTYACSIQSSAGNVLCEGDSLLLAVTGSHAAILWSNQSTDPTIWVYEAESVSVTTWDEWGNSAVSELFEITASEPPSFTSIVTHPLCFGDENGRIELIETSNVISVEWDEENVSFINDSLSEGTYPFTVWNTDGCQFLYEETLIAPAQLELSATITDVSCYSGTDGTASIQIVGGTAPFEIDWADFAPEELEASDFQVSVTDFNGCEQTISITVSEPEPIVVELLGLDCDNDLTVSADVSGGISPYILIWSNGMEGEVFQAPVGVYALYVTDANGCVHTVSDIECPSGVNEKRTTEVSMFPNPASDAINVVVSEEMLGTILRILDTQGRVIWAEEVKSTHLVLEVSDWPEGLYFFAGNRLVVQR